MRAPIKQEAEFEALLAHTSSMERPAMYRLMTLLSIRLGLRPMELAGLDISWFRSDELRIPLGHSKRKSGRSLPLSSEIVEALKTHMGDNEGRVFRNARGEAFDANGISMAMRRLYKRAGIEGSCYSGRRTLATSMVDKDINIAVVSKVLGHSSIATTQKYVGVSDNMMRRALFG